MIMKAAIFTCLVALSAFSYAQPLNENHLKSQKDAEDKLSIIASKLVSEVQDAVDAFNAHYQSKLSDGEAEIDGVVSSALLQLQENSHVYGAECLEETKAQLQAAKHNALYNFFHCKNLTDVLLDAGAMVSDSIFVIGDLFNVVSDAKASFSDCYSFNPFKSVPCFISEISKTVGRVTKMYTIVKEYKKTMGDLDDNLKRNFQVCMHPDVNGIHQNVQAIIEKAGKCT